MSRRQLFDHFQRTNSSTSASEIPSIACISQFESVLTDLSSQISKILSILLSFCHPTYRKNPWIATTQPARLAQAVWYHQSRKFQPETGLGTNKWNSTLARWTFGWLPLPWLLVLRLVSLVVVTVRHSNGKAFAFWEYRIDYFFEDSGKGTYLETFHVLHGPLRSFAGILSDTANNQYTEYPRLRSSRKEVCQIF